MNAPALHLRTAVVSTRAAAMSLNRAGVPAATADALMDASDDAVIDLLTDPRYGRTVVFVDDPHLEDRLNALRIAYRKAQS